MGTFADQPGTAPVEEKDQEVLNAEKEDEKADFSECVRFKPGVVVQAEDGHVRGKDDQGVFPVKAQGAQ